MTLDYTKMFLIVTEEAVVKGHFDFYGNFAPKGALFYCPEGKFTICLSDVLRTKASLV